LFAVLGSADDNQQQHMVYFGDAGIAAQELQVIHDLQVTQQFPLKVS
jgi:hypothetical protein